MKLLKQLGFLSVIFSSFVLANFESDFINTFGYAFGEYNIDFIFLKLMLWFLLFAVIFWSLFRVVFEGNRFIAAIVAFIIATVGIRFIPDVLLDNIGRGFYIFILLIFLLGILLLPKILSKFAGVSSSKGKFMLYLFVYGAVAYVIFLITDFSFENETISEIINRMVDFLRDYPLAVIIGLFAIGIYAIFKLKVKK